MTLEVVDSVGDTGRGTGICIGGDTSKSEALPGRTDTEDELGDDSGDEGSELDHDADLGRPG